MDNLGAHKSIDVIQLAQDNNVSIEYSMQCG